MSTNTAALLQELTAVTGTPFYDEEVLNLLTSKLVSFGDVQVDAMHNVSCTFGSGYHVVLEAHWDEICFVVTGISDDGYVHFAKCGGIDPRILPGARVVVHGKRDLPGVISTLPPHLQKGEDGKKVAPIDELSVDLGLTAQAAKDLVAAGDCVTFAKHFTPLDGTRVSANCLDDRIGCMLMIELLQSELEADTWFCFQVQEEVGLRGAACTGSRVQPDRVLVLEATTAADLDGVTGDKRVCVLGDGPVVSFMDGATIYDRALYRMARETADENGIPSQTKTAIAGGNDAGALQRAGQGSAALAVSLPCRYIHSGASVVQQSDIDATRALLAALLPKLYD